jgi:predicted O-methyltransferase YrrM
MQMLGGFLYYRPRIEAALSALDKRRLRLPVVNLAALFDDFAKQPVTLNELPTGPWSSPVADVVMLAKIAMCLKPKRVMEIGSFRGYTTKLLAEHTGPEARIVAFDQDPRHGAIYRDMPISAKIERRVGLVSAAAFANDARHSYDLIFIDANHTYAAVKHDTEVMLPLLAPEGMMVWHDYANWGRFSRMNGVPEALHELAESKPVVAIGGSWLAAYSPSWSTDAGSQRLKNASQASLEGLPGEDPWTTTDMRG